MPLNPKPTPPAPRKKKYKAKIRPSGVGKRGPLKREPLPPVEPTHEPVLFLDVPLVPKDRSGRPQKPITPEMIIELGRIHCTVPECSAVLGISQELLEKNFIHYLHKGWEEGQKSLKRKMHEKAMQGDTTMLIWLSKQRLGYKERQAEDAQQTTINVHINEIPR